MKISEKGMPEEEIFAKLESFRADDLKWQEGRAYGYVFDAGSDVARVAKKAYTDFLSENGLDFTVFKSLAILEKELASFCARHLQGDEAVVGNFTSGGTESIILAVKAARDYYREKKPEITSPQIILPATAHAAFHKAAHYLGIEVVLVSVDLKTFKVPPEAVRAAITPNTIMLVGSAPSYAVGVIDPIAELGDIALENDLWLHSDGCMGGFQLPYFKQLGEPVPDFDFSVPGVSSISIDLHKYAYTPKGASMVMYRSKELRKHQIFASSSWIGYTIVNNAVQSSKSGGPMAAAWAVLNYVGNEGYLEIARKTLAAVKKIAAGVEKIDGIRLLARPEMSLVAFSSDTIDVFHIIDEMNSRGWYVQPALSFDGSPANIHLSIGASNVGWEDDLLKDLAECVQIAATLPEGDMVKMAREAIHSMDLTAISDADMVAFLSMAGIGGDQELPDRMADINGILNELPPDAREKILINFVNDLFVQ